MRYYVYISDTKIDMLLPQVPHDLKKKVATEFGIDFKLLTAKRKIEQDSDENRISRLEAVVTFIEESGRVGCVDKPDQYVKDVMPMRWGPYAHDERPGLVYFGGETERTIVGLGGSLSHVTSFPIWTSLLKVYRNPHRTKSGTARTSPLCIWQQEVE